MTKNQCLAELDTTAVSAFRNFLDELDSVGLKYSITETRRTQLTQIVYYCQGRMELEDVNKIRSALYLPVISESENKPITWTLKSNHMTGRAVDIVPLTSNDKPNWNDISTYQKIADIAKKHGIQWGGDWKERDYPHFELM
jgi:peptidoglycan L-alanyl-D-glutamate endopeptidase CwlK